MTFDEDFALRLAAHLESEDPDPRFKRARSVSRRELIANSYEVLMAKRRAGYSLDGLAAQIAAFGMRISASTLERYLRMAALNKSAQRADSPTNTAARSSRSSRATSSGDRRKRPSSVEAAYAPVLVPGSREENAQNAALGASPNDDDSMAHRSVGSPATPVEENRAERVETKTANTRVTEGSRGSDDAVPLASEHLSGEDRALSIEGTTDAAPAPRADGATAMPAAAAADSAPATPAAQQNARAATRGSVTGSETSPPAGATPTSTTSAEGSNSTTPQVKAGVARPPMNAPLLGNIGFMPRR